MYGRLAAKLNRPLLGLIPRNQYCLPERLLSASVGRTADPDLHGGDVDEYDAAEAKKAETATGESEIKPSSTGKVPISPSKSPCGSSPKIESKGVNNRIDPNVQQKRRNSNASIPDVSCAGLDGGPWPDDATDRRRQEDDNKEYFKHHKASPLSGLKMADTRKPITRATDGSSGGAAAGGVVVWLPEQLESAEDTLLRAMEIWKENAARGDPDSPHGKILRNLRGEYW